MKHTFSLVIVFIFILVVSACGHGNSETTSKSPHHNKVEGISKKKEQKQQESNNQNRYQGEPKKETGIQAQQTANKVQEYVVNMVNDLTIIENMSSDIQSSLLNSQIYGSGNSQTGANGPKVILPNYNQQFKNSMDMMTKALDDMENQQAPQNTEYFVLEPQFNNFAHKYLTIIDDIKTNNNSDKLSNSIHELQQVDIDIQDLEISFADSIGANNYAEYDALLSVWRQGKNYHDNNTSHVIIASGIKMGLYRDYRIDFYSELNQK